MGEASLQESSEDIHVCAVCSWIRGPQATRVPRAAFAISDPEGRAMGVFGGKEHLCGLHWLKIPDPDLKSCSSGLLAADCQQREAAERCRKHPRAGAEPNKQRVLE